MRTDRLGVAAILALSGCGRPEGGPAEGALPRDVTAELSAGAPTVIHVRWTTDRAVSGRVEFGGRSTPDDAPTTDHHHLLIGSPPETEVRWRIVSDGAPADEGALTTGPLPDRPDARLEGAAGTRWYATSLMSEGVARIALVDPEGRIVWDHLDTRGLSVFRARVALDGSGIWYASAVVNGGPSPDSVLVHVTWDGEEDRVIPVPDLAHDFVELSDGTLGALTYATVDGVLGNALVEIAPDGEPTGVWSSWDCFDPAEHPGDDPEHGWTHGNALDYDPEGEAYLVGLRNLHTIARVERATGTCSWAFGGTGGDVAIDGPKFVHQHQFEAIDGGLLVFDNDGAPGNESRVVEYTFDPEAKTASLLRTFGAQPPLYSFILGDVHRLPDGDTMIAWSVPSMIDQVDGEGARRFRLDFPDGILLGFVQSMDDPCRPE